MKKTPLLIKEGLGVVKLRTQSAGRNEHLDISLRNHP